ncbi:MAG TPA: hypothetical protein VM733_06290 [Thermoanaerobaculia bacterium]|nr:hypothetical protein [Thermoanaerobaculia bacterium]
MGTPNILPFANGQFGTKMEATGVLSNCGFALAELNKNALLVYADAASNDMALLLQKPGSRRDPEILIGGSTYVAPAAAAFNGEFFVAYAGTNQQLYIMAMDGDLHYLSQNTLQQASYVSPSLAVFNNLLYMAYTGEDSKLNVWFASDGKDFGHKQNFDYLTNAGPSLAAFNNRLYMAFSGTDGQIYITSSEDGQNFGTPQQLANQSNLTPSLAASPDGSVLYMAFTGTDGRPNIWSSPDGTTWDNGTKQTSQNWSWNPPALMAFGNEMYLGFTGEDGASSENVLQAFAAFVKDAAGATSTILAILGDAFTGNWSDAISEMRGLITGDDFSPVLQALSAAGLNTFGFVGGDEGGVVVAGGVTTGILTGTSDHSKFYSYLDVGISIGTTEGDSVVLGLYASTDKPDDIGGLEFFTEAAGDLGAGAALVAFVGVFGGTGMIAFVTTGEEEELSVGVGVAISDEVS